MMEVTTRRLGYDDLVNAWMAKDYGARRVAYDARCKDPVCQTIVKAMFEGSQGCGWSFMWALHILAVDLAFDQLLADVPGNCIGAIEACIGGWETDDESDYINAMIVYNRLVGDDAENDLMKPVNLFSLGGGAAPGPPPKQTINQNRGSAPGPGPA